jgi:hypothetical protein
MTRIFNARDAGAFGDGGKDDWAALQSALTDAAAVDGVLLLPAGRYLISKPLALTGCRSCIALRGDGANVSVIVAQGGIDALCLDFEQDGARQPWGINLQDVGFEAVGRAGTAIRISYGNPVSTSDHYRPSTTIRAVSVVSGPAGSWSGGIDIEAAWNVTMDDVYVSGDSCGGNWNAMSGNGIQFRRMCINAHLTNVRCNFWAVGFFYDAAGGGNTEGLFFSNCSMVAVQRGNWIIGNPSGSAPRMSTFVWTGGMIECRVSGVEGGSAAFHLVNVWSALITGAQLIADVLPTTHTTYGLFLDNCAGIVVTGCDVNAWNIGLFTTGQCTAINSHGNTYTNCARQNVFNPGTVQSRSFGHVCFNDKPNDQDPGGANRLGFAV